MSESIREPEPAPEAAGNPITASQPDKLPWYRFTLRRLMYWIFLISLPLAWMGWDYNNVQSRRRAVAVIERLGGQVKYRHTVGQLPQPRPGLVPLRKLLGDDYFFKVVGVDLSGTQVTDADLESLDGVRDIEILLLNDTKITDGGLRHLWRIGRIGTLELRNTKITDEGLERVGEVASLMHLNIEGTEVTDAGLEHLKNMPNFSTVACRGTHVTQEGAAELKHSYSRPVGVGWSGDFPAELHQW